MSLPLAGRSFPTPSCRAADAASLPFLAGNVRENSQTRCANESTGLSEVLGRSYDESAVALPLQPIAEAESFAQTTRPHTFYPIHRPVAIPMNWTPEVAAIHERIQARVAARSEAVNARRPEGILTNHIEQTGFVPGFLSIRHCCNTVRAQDHAETCRNRR